MYNEFGSSDHTYHAQRAYEIELRVRELEKKSALMNYVNRRDAGNSFIDGVKKTARRLSGLVGALFVS